MHIINEIISDIDSPNYRKVTNLGLHDIEDLLKNTDLFICVDNFF